MKKIKGILGLAILSLVLVACRQEEEVTEIPEETEVLVEETETEEETEKEILYRSLLSGEETEEDKSKRNIVGIMLDNHPRARWQAGMSQAEVVYEIRVEGNFTRYLALFQVNDPEAIGPVRSARTPFVNRILEHEAIYLHYGGTDQVVQDIVSQGIHNINGMAVGEPVYYRNFQVGKSAPHNAYTSMEAIRNYMADRGWPEETSFTGYNFYEEPTAPGGDQVHDFSFTIMPGNQTAYSYQPDQGTYQRYKDGQLHLDENTQEPLAVTNILVQFTNGVLAANGVHVNLDEIGQGRGLYFSQGQVVDITWQKDGRGARTHYFTSDGQPLLWNVGQTFIQIVDENVQVNMDSDQGE